MTLRSSWVELREMARRKLQRWTDLEARWFAPPLTAAEIQTTLAAMTTSGLTKKINYRTLQSPMPIWHREWFRLTRTIMVDLRMVTDTHAASDLPWLDVGALCTLYGAQVCVEWPPYFGDGYTNTDPTDTAQDAAYLTLTTTRFNRIKTAADLYGFTVRTVLAELEVFAAVPNKAADPTNEAINTALNLKFSQIYDIPKGLFGANDNPGSGSSAVIVGFYGQGAIRPESSENAMTLPNCETASGAASPYPWGGGWGPLPWNINPYDVADLSDPYTLGDVTPWLGDVICPAMYYPHEPETNERCLNWSRNWNPSKAIIPFLSMGQARERSFANWIGVLREFEYATELSKLYGASFDNAPYHNTQARQERWGYEMSEIMLWPAPNDSKAPKYMDHAIEFLRGMKS